jgi:uncharacterized membrane protein YfcA
MKAHPKRRSVDDPTDTRPVAPPRATLRELPPYLVAGNRFGSYGFGCGLGGLLLAIAPFGHTLAAVLVVAAVVLSATGFIRYAQDGATNRDTAVVGLAMGWIGLTVLMMRLAAALDLPPEAFTHAGP